MRCLVSKCDRANVTSIATVITVAAPKSIRTRNCVTSRLYILLIGYRWLPFADGPHSHIPGRENLMTYELWWTLLCAEGANVERWTNNNIHLSSVLFVDEGDNADGIAKWLSFYVATSTATRLCVLYFDGQSYFERTLRWRLSRDEYKFQCLLHAHGAFSFIFSHINWNASCWRADMAHEVRNEIVCNYFYEKSLRSTFVEHKCGHISL